MSADQTHAKALKTALLALDPSGPQGFEGLLGIVLGELTGQSFRLAKSGTQRGRDGDSAFDGGATYFEGKRYKEGLQKNDVSAKLFDVANDDTGQVDLWILGATCEVASQTVEDARTFAANYGFGIAVLDWLNNDLGSLLIAVVAAASKSKELIAQALKDKPEAVLVVPAVDAIDYFGRHVDFASRLGVLRKALADDVGLGHAKTLSEAWLNRIFSSKARARAEFGQPLCPLDPTGSRVLDRPERAVLTEAFSGAPQNRIYAIVGEEGVGKSWLAIQGWSRSLTKSLFVLCPAEDLTDDESDDFDSFLIRRLIRQTSGSDTPQAIKRWRRRFHGWRANLPARSVRLTLVVDGLNQTLKSNWGRWIGRAALHLHDLGGCLVLTTRTQHWAHLKNTLPCDTKTVSLAEWSIQDVKEILLSRDIDFANVRPEVLESVRNPRLLGIAIELIQAKAIELLDELSVGRLLFEHMRRMQQLGAAPLPAQEFADLLKDLAATILSRAKAFETDDLRLFNAVQEPQLQAVASCQFFSSVKGTSSRYEIKPNGLNLALALHLVGQLEREVRNGRDPRDKLATILEPISALDETGRVVLLATQIACLDEETSIQIPPALIENLVTLQNLPNSQVEAFAVLAKSAPVAFMKAAENLHLSHEHNGVNDWLLHALLSRREQPTVWQEILTSTKRWLSYYSLEPTRRMRMSIRSDNTTRVDEERSRIETEIQARLAAITEAERSFMMAKLIIAPHPNFDSLSHFALYLLSGMPLVEIAPYFVRWRFSYALHYSLSAPYEEFEHVLRFNRVDWHETRAALLQELESLPGQGCSDVGRWTRVGILHGTGDIGDAIESERIFDEIKPGQKLHEGWSLIEDHCAVDPCNPNSTMPDNVTTTAKRYRELDVGKVATGRALSEQGHFFRSARSGIARFLSDDAIYSLRALANDVLDRTGFERRQGVLELMRHSAGLTKEQASRFLAAGVSCPASHKDTDDGKDEFLTAQFSTLIALPHLSANEQLDAIANMQGDTVLLELLDCVHRATEEKVEHVLERVLNDGNTHSQTAVLAAIHYSQSPLTPRAVMIVKGFIRTPLKGLRHEALAVAASSDNDSLWQEVIDSGWCAAKPRGRDSSFEDWHGSMVLVKALRAGLIEVGPALDRMSLSHYGFAAETLPVERVRNIADRVEIAIAKALEYGSDVELPDIETEVPNSSNSTPPLISLTERVTTESDFASKMSRLAESDEQFNERRRRMGDSYERFASELTAADADLILSDLTFEGIQAIIGQDVDRAQRWIKIFLATSDRALRNLYHVALQVAIMFGDRLALRLLERVLALVPIIRRVTGIAKIPMEAIALWRRSETPEIRDVCIKRLQSSRNDSEIAQEVIAAHLSGNVLILQTYIDELLASERPCDTMLALMIAGFCDESVHADGVLSRFAGAKGFVGSAHAAASEWYAKNIWAKTWYGAMLSAQQPKDFWRASVLFMKIVDGRFDLWSETSSEPSIVFKAFMPTIVREVGTRVAKAQKKREAKLFGEKAPSSIMLKTK
ncbi:hypothetical protein D3C76_140210 [compost metagenome]